MEVLYGEKISWNLVAEIKDLKVKYLSSDKGCNYTGGRIRNADGTGCEVGESKELCSVP